MMMIVMIAEMTTIVGMNVLVLKNVVVKKMTMHVGLNVSVFLKHVWIAKMMTMNVGNPVGMKRRRNSECCLYFL